VTIRSAIETGSRACSGSRAERASRFAETLGRAGFTDLDSHAATLSGGWRKALHHEPWSRRRTFSCWTSPPTSGSRGDSMARIRSAARSVRVCGGQQTATSWRTSPMEWWNSIRPTRMAVARGRKLSAFLEAKEEYLHAQKKRRSRSRTASMRNLSARRGPKARATKAKAPLTRPRDDRRTRGR